MSKEESEASRRSRKAVEGLRPCSASGHQWYFEGHFHLWLTTEVDEPEHVGRPGDIVPTRRVKKLLAVVEDRDGCVHQIEPYNFRFLDRHDSMAMGPTSEISEVRIDGREVETK